MNIENKIDTRNYGIDLLRIVSMIMILVLHICDIGGMLTFTDRDANDTVGYFFYAMSFCAVNCFALISGYVGYKSKHKYANIIYLTLQVIFILLV